MKACHIPTWMTEIQTFEPWRHEDMKQMLYPLHHDAPVAITKPIFCSVAIAREMWGHGCQMFGMEFTIPYNLMQI